MTTPGLQRLVLALPLALGLAACSGTPARTVDVDGVVTTALGRSKNAQPGSLVFTMLHVRTPARPEGRLPEGFDAVLLPPNLLLEHPHEKKDPETGERYAFESSMGGLKNVATYAPMLDGEGAAAPLYAPLLAAPVAIVSTATEVAIGWTGVGPRVWVRPCRHGLAGRLDLVVENDVLRYRDDEPLGTKPGRACLERAWFAGADAVYFGPGRPTALPNDPGRESLSLVVVSVVK
jgi:hypothetical protein